MVAIMNMQKQSSNSDQRDVRKTWLENIDNLLKVTKPDTADHLMLTILREVYAETGFIPPDTVTEPTHLKPSHPSG